MTMMRRFLIPAILLIAAAIFLPLTLGTKSAEADKGFLSDLISRALSTPSTQVSIGDVEGALSSDATIRNITISDKDGVWFRLDRVRLVWRRLALLSRRLEIDKLEIGKLEVLRRPIPTAATVAGADQPLLPELPVKVQIADFLLRELSLGAPVIGVAARLTASGAASLGDPKEGLNLRFDARRLDAPGTLVARLNYVAEKLDLNLALDEPAGGILARSANIPGLPPVKLNVAGTGTLDAFGARLTFTAGDTIGAAGQASLQRQGGVRRLVLDLNAQLEGLLPALAAPVFAGTTELDSETIFADDGTIIIPQLSVVSRTARLDASGRMEANRAVDFKLSARAVPTDQQKTIAGGAEIKTLAFTGTVKGQLSAPEIAGQLSAEDVNLPAGRLGNLEASFTAMPSGALSDNATRIAIMADAKATGVALADQALARAVGDRMSLVIRATASPDGLTEVETAHLSSPSLDARYTGQLGAETSTGLLVAKAPDLSRFGDVASLRLRGTLDLEARLRGLMSNAAVTASIDAKAMQFGTGIATLDGLIGDTFAMNGTVRTFPKGGFGFETFRVLGEHVTIRIDGNAGPESVAVDARIEIPDLRRADRRLTGQGRVESRLSGTLDQPNATFHAEVKGATALNRPIPELSLDATATDILGAAEIAAKIAGTVDGKAAAGTLRLLKRQQGGWVLDPLDFVVGSAKIRGNLTLDSADLATGHVSLDARNLGDLAPIVLTPLSGDVKADVVFDATTGQQNVRLDAQGERLKVGDATVERLSARVSIVDLYAKPVINAAIAADRAVLAGETFSQIRLDSAGSPSASEISLSAKAREFDLAARGRLVPETPVRFDLTAFTATRDRHRISLARPASIAFGEGGVALRGLEMSVGGGTISAEGRVGSTLDLRVAAKAVPLSAADILRPGTGLSGTLEGTAQISGPAAAPTGDWRVRVSRLVAAQARAFGAPPIDITAQGRLADGNTTVNGVVDAGRAGTFRIDGRVPLDAARDLDLSARGRLDLSVANSFLSAEGRQMTGVAAIDMRVTGRPAEPTVNGTLTLGGGSFRDALQGVRLDNIQARIAARGTDVMIERFSAVTRNNGTIYRRTAACGSMRPRASPEISASLGSERNWFPTIS